MEISIDILNELKEISPLIAGMERTNVFTVPDHYFADLPYNILIALKEGRPDITSFPADQLLEVPQGYFDTLADSILARIKSQQEESVSDELRQLSPMLYSIQNENVFEVPRGYFDALPDTILAQVRPADVKVVDMRRRSHSFMKYAVAAAVTGIMALGVFTFIGGNNEKTDAVVAQGTQIAKENRFDEELAKISDEEIVKYLESTGSDVTAAMVANSVDENELPAEEDYLTDDKALDKYLNSINVSDLKN